MDEALTTTLATLGPLLAKVAEVHGRQDPRLAEVAAGFEAIRAALEAGRPGLGAAAAGLDRLGALTDGFSPPEHACRSYRRALSDLEWLRGQVARAAAPPPPHAAPRGPHPAAGRRHGAKR